ncbi:MAG: phenylalanine--tRNA ligase subunit beta [Proteobacteria bacterium]|nr:MAG: phenylalanine--tRNA ligase subunit beta [Pseudomonadota bacterium]
MKISEQWIKEWVAINNDTDATVSQLTMLGLEVDEVLPAAGHFSGVVVAEIMACKPHPNADKLQVCEVYDGQDNLQIVCGATNARSGIKVALARIGAVLPGDFNIKKSKLRGEDSFGMLCSEVELGLSDEGSGILELPQDAPVGESIRDYLALNDHIIDIDLTPNRADCFCVRGVARELATSNKLALTEPLIKTAKVSIDETVSVTVKAAQACARYSGRIIKGINNQTQTPLWLKERLRKSGLRSIHPVVDVTNYVMLEWGQPMHAFDYHQVDQGIVVRMAHDQESITLLDGTEAQLDDSFLMIADHSKPLAVAGVMGGLDSGVQADSRDIILESAYFDPAHIMGKSRRLGTHTDSSLRFERGVDWQLQEQAMERATELILTICGGQAGPIHTETSEQHIPRRQNIPLKAAHLQRVLGFEVPFDRVTEIFSHLGFQVDTDEFGWTVITPSWRFDLSIAEDLIEEVVRVVGYDQMPADLLHSDDVINSLPEQQALPIVIKKQLVAKGFQEVINYAFVAEQQLTDSHLEQSAYSLANPLSKDMAVMRTHLLPGILANIQANRAHGEMNLALFELGKVFNQAEGQELQQQDVLMLATSGHVQPEQWGVAERQVDFYDLKGQVDDLLNQVPGQVDYQVGSLQFLHPGRQADIYLDGQCIGHIGQVHPSITQPLKIKSPVYVAQLHWQAIEKRQLPQWQADSKYPGTRRDLSIQLADHLSWQTVKQGLESTIRKESEDLRQILLFDVYKGEHIEKGYKSFAIALIFQAKNRTLEDKEVDKLVANGVSFLEQKLNAVIRT